MGQEKLNTRKKEKKNPLSLEGSRRVSWLLPGQQSSGGYEKRIHYINTQHVTRTCHKYEAFVVKDRGKFCYAAATLNNFKHADIGKRKVLCDC